LNKKYIRIEEGTYRGSDQSGRVFILEKDYQKYMGREEGFVTVNVSELNGYEGLDKVRITVPNIQAIDIVSEAEYLKFKQENAKTTSSGSKEKEESDEEAISRIEGRFNILTEMTEAVAQQKVKGMIVSGPPGIGKSYGVESCMDRYSTFDDIAGKKRKFEVVKGAMSAIGLYKKLYEHADAGHVVCFDDCDVILYDDLCLNLLKAALDTGRRRTLHWNTESRFLHSEGVPNSFEFRGGVIFITNVKFDNVKSKKLRDHLEALQSRCHYLDLTIDSMRDRMLRIRQIVRAGMLDKYNMPDDAKAALVDYIFENKHRLREISLRMVLKVADLWKMKPDGYQQLADQTCMRSH
jgi:hypothetical protein|tara:strand:+ start:340 stop:1392 length:1053 start_codon:yes stop_codon:yes gene_type:complete